MVKRHPSILWTLIRQGGTERLATEATIHGLNDAKSSSFSSSIKQPISPSSIGGMIRLAKKEVPYHDCAFLYYLVKALRPKTIIETGVWYGYSSAFILQALEEVSGGTLVSIDLRAEDFPEKLDVGFAVPDRLRSNWTLILGPSKSQLPAVLQPLERIDLFIHDSDHSYENMIFEFRTAWTKLRPGGVMVADNVEWNSAFDDFCKEVSQEGVKERSLASTHGILIK